MPITMNESARYVTQQSVFAVPFTGPLTNRKIARYIRQGYYKAESIIFRRTERAKRAKRKTAKDIFRPFLTS